MASGNGVMEKLIDYVSKARKTALPPEVATKTKHHILDTLAAMISGATLKPGEMALKYARLQKGGPKTRRWWRAGWSCRSSRRRSPTACSAIPTRPTIPTAVPASIPGCAVLPAALGMAEKEDSQRPGRGPRRCARLRRRRRINKALGRDALRARSTLPFSDRRHLRRLGRGRHPRRPQRSRSNTATSSPTPPSRPPAS
jgi:hypothetical protein